jgi:hypothetical protein
MIHIDIARGCGVKDGERDVESGWLGGGPAGWMDGWT